MVFVDTPSSSIFDSDDADARQTYLDVSIQFTFIQVHKDRTQKFRWFKYEKQKLSYQTGQRVDGANLTSNYPAIAQLSESSTKTRKVIIPPGACSSCSTLIHMIPTCN
jgi:hypothetical protein